MASDARTRQDHRVPSSARGRRSRGVRLHPHERVEYHHCRAAVRSPGLPLRADLLELGVGDAVRFRVVRGALGRSAECVVGTGRRAAATPQRQSQRRGEQPVGDAGIPDSLPRFAGSLRRVGSADQRAASARERRRGVVARALQDRRRSGAVAPRQPRVRQPRGVRDVSAADRDDAKRGPEGSFRRGIGNATGLARAAAVVVFEGALPCRYRQLDSPSAQHLFGAQPAGRRAGRGVALRRPCRDLVRGQTRRYVAATRGPGPLGGSLSARHRLAGTQTRSVRELRLPRRFVPDDAFPPGLRPVLRGRRRTSRRQGLPEDPASCGPHQRGRRRRRLTRAADA